MVAQLGEQRFQVGAQGGGGPVELAEQLVEGGMLGLELGHRLDEVALVAQRGEDAGLLAPHVPGEQVGQCSHPGPRPVELVQVEEAPYLTGVVEKLQVLVHQLGDRADSAAAAVLTHTSSVAPRSLPEKGTRSRFARAGG